MGVASDQKILTYEKGYISVTALYTQYQLTPKYQIWNGASWSDDYTMDIETAEQTYTITTDNQLQVTICDNQELLIAGDTSGYKTYSQLQIGDKLTEYAFPQNMSHLTDPDTVTSPLAEGLFMITGGLTYKNHNIVQIPYNIRQKLPIIQQAVYADIYNGRQTVLFVDSPVVTKGTSWVPYGYSTTTKLQWLEGIFYMAGNTQIYPSLQFQMISSVGLESQLNVFRHMQLAMHELGVNSHIHEYIYSSSTPIQCTTGNFVDPTCAIEFLLDYNNISMVDGQKYYMLYTTIISTEHLLNAGFKQNLTIFTRNLENLNKSQWRDISIYNIENSTIQQTYNINEKRSGHFLVNGILLKSYVPVV